MVVWLRFSLHGHEAVHVPEALFRYRTSPNSMSQPWSEGQGALTVELLRRALRAAAQSPSVSRERLVSIADQGVALASRPQWEANVLRGESAAAASVWREHDSLDGTIVAAGADPCTPGGGPMIGERLVATAMRVGRRVVGGSQTLTLCARSFFDRLGSRIDVRGAGQQAFEPTPRGRHQ